MSKLLATTTRIGEFTPPTDAFSTDSSVSPEAAASNLEHLISNMLGALTLVASLAFLIYFLLGGINWISAGGDSGKIQKAREQMLHGVMGLIVIVISYAVIGVIGQVVGLDLLRPGETIINNLIP